MKLIIDTDEGTIAQESDGETRTLNLYSPEAFKLLSREWVRVGWDQKYPYTFSWMGRPIIQLPEDLIRTQEVIYRVKPDIIVETGVAHGGSLIFYASLCRAMNKGRIIGIDIEIYSHNRRAIEGHELYELITLIEGNSVDEGVVNSVRSQIKSDEVVLVILDSNHSKQHVLQELHSYHEFVTPGSYIVATDGIMFDLNDVPRGVESWRSDNPREAAREFVESHTEFKIEQPTWPFNESNLKDNVTHWPGAWLKRLT